MSFAQAVDRERTTAQWADGILTIVLPKLRGLRVKVQ
jgi:HSP20 family molecular chaperone IbpA